MSWTKVVNLECDGGEYGCLSTPEHPEHNETVDEARATATDHGWQHKDGLDLCPICVYIRKTGCTCEVLLYDKGRVERAIGFGLAHDCKIHDPRRNSKNAQR